MTKFDAIRALVIDASDGGRRHAQHVLSSWAPHVRVVSSATEAAVALGGARPEVVLVGADSPDALDAVAWYAALGCDVYLVCDRLDVDLAQRALGRGARGLVPRGAELAALGAGRQEPDHELDAWRRSSAADLIGIDMGLVDALSTIRAVADTEATVLIRGESGTGKELLARALHAGSPRANGPFIAINCAAIPEPLVEAELFGHTRGAFTGASNARLGVIASADNGTLFLDEIGDMPLTLQAKLLRVLQGGELTPVGSDRPIRVQVRVVAATHRDLEAMVAAGDFRADLYYRLNVVSVDSPPLRTRYLDLLHLAMHHLLSANKQHGRAATGFDPDAVRALLEHSWPGNVRELANVVARAVLVRRQGLVRAGDLRLDRRPGAPPPAPAMPTFMPVPMPVAVQPAAPLPVPNATPAQGLPVLRGPGGESLNLRAALDSVEREMIERALTLSNGNRSEAAALLGLNRTTLLEKLRKHGT